MAKGKAKPKDEAPAKRSYNQTLLKAASCGFRFGQLLDRGHERGKGRQDRQKPTTMGRAFHAFAPLYYAHCQAEGKGTDLTAVARLVRQAMMGSGLSERDGKDLQYLAEKMAAMEIVPLSSTVHLEERIETKDQRFYGTPDLWEVITTDENQRLLEVVDRKTWRRVPTLAELKEDDQMWLYPGILLENGTEVDLVRMTWRLPRYGKNVSLTVPADEVLARMRDFRARADKLDAWEDREPSAGEACDFCECTAACPLVKAGQIDVIEDEATAKETAEKVVAMGSLVRAMKGRLKAWVDQHGPVELPGVTFNHWPSDGKKFSALDVYNFLTKAGVPPKDVMDAFGINEKGIKRICKKADLDEDTKADALALGQETFKTRFDQKKVKAGATAEEDQDEEGDDD